MAINYVVGYNGVGGQDRLSPDSLEAAAKETCQEGIGVEAITLPVLIARALVGKAGSRQIGLFHSYTLLTYMLTEGVNPANVTVWVSAYNSVKDLAARLSAEGVNCAVWSQKTSLELFELSGVASAAPVEVDEGIPSPS